MNASLTSRIRAYAYELGADLVGIADISRFKNAPIQMSPQGIMPTAKCVIVCAIHHPDVAMELGGEIHPQIQGPYTVQYTMNTKLDYIAFRIANRLDDTGYDAIPIASSNIWRYREFMGLDACFAPDMSHIYAATSAGLGQIGWNGLTMSPEYGPWNRFISIITDAPLESSPMYDEMTLCDRCGECIRHCPTDAFRKEVKPNNKVVETGGMRFEFCNKNLWRCAWGEHFNLDLDLEIPDVVNEQVLLDTIDAHGMRGGEMGCCLKYCLPKHLRAPGGDFTSTYQRKKQSYANLELPVHRRIYDDIADFVRRYSVDDVAYLDEAAVEKLGGKNVFSPAKGAVVYVLRYRPAVGNLTREQQFAHHGSGGGTSGLLATERTAIHQMAIIANLDITRILDNAGYLSMCNTGVDEKAYAEAAGLLHSQVRGGREYTPTNIDGTTDEAKVRDDGTVEVYGVVLTNANFVIRQRRGLQEPVLNPRKTVTENLMDLLREEGSDQYAVVPAARMDKLADRLQELRGGEKLLIARDKNGLYTPFDAEVSEYTRVAHRPTDYVKDAQNVLLFSHHFPQIVTRRTIKEPAYAAGPYLFALYEMTFELGYTALKVCKFLQALGYEAAATYDLTGMGGDIATPRGQLPDAFCNSLEAVEAGLGALTANGVCYTKEHGFSQGFIAIVTNAPLDAVCTAKELPDTAAACKDCDICVKVCPAKAIQSEKAFEITLNGRDYRWMPIEWTRCDWAKKYALCGEAGSKYTSSKTDVPLPEKVTPENLTSALKEIDRVLKFRPTTTQRCVIDCPLVK
ncbi:MAG: 4Fe-4S binding protein [Eubacteriales bacterium]|jgi:epoxyqueuosine reductase